MLDLLEMLENGIVEREEVIASAKKEAEKMHDYIENFEVAGGKITGKGKYCAQLEGFVWDILMHKFYTFHQHYDDLYMAAMVAILEKEDDYDPSRGTLTTYFKPYILHEICAWINANVTFSTVHYSVQEKIINYYLRSIDRDIAEVPVKRVVEMTGCAEKAVRHIRLLKQMRRAGQIEVAVKPTYESGQLTAWYYDTPEDYYLKVEEQEELLERINLLREGMDSDRLLTDREKKTLTAYYGLDGNMPRKMSLIAKETGTYQARVRKDLSSAYSKLRWEIRKGELKKCGCLLNEEKKMEEDSTDTE